jgi:hypothetical protein
LTLSAANLRIGEKITYQGTTYTVTALNGINESTGVSDFGAFYYKSGSKTLHGTVTMPSTMKFIGKNAFRGQSNITKLNLNDGLENFSEHNCFTIGCTQLTSLAIPASVSTLGGYMLGGFVTDLTFYKNDGMYSVKYGPSGSATTSIFYGG